MLFGCCSLFWLCSRPVIEMCTLLLWGSAEIGLEWCASWYRKRIKCSTWYQHSKLKLYESCWLLNFPFQALLYEKLFVKNGIHYYLHEEMKKLMSVSCELDTLLVYEGSYCSQKTEGACSFKILTNLCQWTLLHISEDSIHLVICCVWVHQQVFCIFSCV